MCQYVGCDLCKERRLGEPCSFHAHEILAGEPWGMADEILQVVADR